MSRSRPGPNNHPPNRSPSRMTSWDSTEDFPPLPASRLPSLRTLNSPRDREGSASSPNRPHTRYWTSAASRRAERIRGLGDAPSPPPPPSSAVMRAMEQSSPESLLRRLNQIRAADVRPTSLDDLDRSLDEANSHLRALLQMTPHASLSTPLLPPSYSPPPPAAPQPPQQRPQQQQQESSDESSRRSKRRKVDADRHAAGFQGFCYGHYGQVEPGELHMEMVSCDGGMFSNELSYAAENILKNDNSVYCTKGNRCNIVLRHQGSTAFTLSELVIKAPGSMNYSHPYVFTNTATRSGPGLAANSYLLRSRVREGMVFIAMDQDEVLARTAQYQIQYTPNPRDRFWFTSSSSSHHHADDSHSRSPRHVISIRHHDDGTFSTRARSSYVYHQDDDTATTTNSNDPNDIRMPQMPPEFSHNQPDFNIITECSDEEEEGYTGPAPTSILRRPAPNRIGSLPFENADSDSDADSSDNHHTTQDLLGGPPTDAPFPSLHRVRARGSQPNPSSLSVNFNLHPNAEPTPRPTSRASSSATPAAHITHPNNISLAEAWDAHASATQDAIRAVGGGSMLAPHARFFIEKKKSKCTIRFDPPVSGRFILLKMWSSQHDPGSNIDIQSVMARGFAGPRYFPSVELH
ncbi:hypothetical protein K4F52_009134 [Lecanicillium sp. MT-2017a]|nr:hypothetical protein K4F52_009134 [Lecanicillium sp. MT-2017a]